MYQNECCFCGVDIFIIIIIIIIIVKLKGILRACRGGVCILLCCLHLSPTVTADKMASEVMSDSQDEKAALLEKDEQQQSGGAAKQSECKLRLYHWTQSFNSQKVSVQVAPVQNHSRVDSSWSRAFYYSCLPTEEVSASQVTGQLLISGLIRFLFGCQLFPEDLLYLFWIYLVCLM